MSIKALIWILIAVLVLAVAWNFRHITFYSAHIKRTDTNEQPKQREERLVNRKVLAQRRTAQCTQLNAELVEALRSVRSHLGKNELAILERAEKMIEIQSSNP
ncbi:MAG TPA: hypothetical protein VFA90_01150 [Terriglobales bacterium]|nr:hypothetical protein [Terriglobales bacterium]